MGAIYNKIKYIIDIKHNYVDIWRTDRDSNPGDSSPPTHFPGVRLRPLGHLSIGGGLGDCGPGFKSLNDGFFAPPVIAAHDSVVCEETRACYELLSGKIMPRASGLRIQISR